MEEEDTDSDDESELSNEDGMYTQNINCTTGRKHPLTLYRTQSILNRKEAHELM